MPSIYRFQEKFDHIINTWAMFLSMFIAIIHSDSKMAGITKPTNQFEELTRLKKWSPYYLSLPIESHEEDSDEPRKYHNITVFPSVQYRARERNNNFMAPRSSLTLNFRPYSSLHMDRCAPKTHRQIHLRPSRSLPLLTNPPSPHIHL